MQFPFEFTLLSCILIYSTTQALHSTKTAYMDSFSPEQLEFIHNPENFVIEGCQPEQIYLFLRHGARYPNEKQVAKSKEFLAEVQKHRSTSSSSNQKAKSNIDDLVVTFNDKPNYALSELGKIEMHQIAQRFSKRYPVLFDPKELLHRVNTQRYTSFSHNHNFDFI
jgi:hypothetical protein